MSGQIKPGLFGKTVAADNRRMDFDFANEQLLYLNKRPDILFIGDSITQLWELYAYFKTEKLLINRGIGGDTTEYLLKRFDADVIQLKPYVAVIMAGTNDISATNDDLWWRKKGLDKEPVLAAFKENMAAMAKKCFAAGIKPVLCSVTPSEIAPPFHRELRWEMTAEMNGFMKEFCREKDMIFVDYHSKLCQNDGKTLIYELSPDGIHLNAKGYEIMAAVLRETIWL